MAKAMARLLPSDYVPVPAAEGGAVVEEGFLLRCLRVGVLKVEDAAALAEVSTGAILGVGVMCYGGEFAGEAIGEAVAKETGINKQASIEGGKLVGAVFTGAAAGAIAGGPAGAIAGATLGLTGWVVGEISDAATGWALKKFSCHHF